MGVFKTADGRTLVGIGQQDGNEYSGFNGWRDCVIQLTASGATENSVKYLNAIKDYAIVHNAKGESIMPPNLSIWISNNGATTAVQADDIAVDGANVTICGIKWNGTAWDYTDAGKGSSGSGSQGPLVLTAASTANPPFLGTVSGATKQEILDAWNAGRRVSVSLMGNEVILTVGSQLGSNNPILVGNFLFNTNNITLFCGAYVHLNDMSYSVTPFTGLTNG